MRFSGDFLRCKINIKGSCTDLESSHYYPYHQLTDVTDGKLGAIGHWLGTRTGVANLNFFWPQPMAPWMTGTASFSNGTLDLLKHV